MLTTADGIRSIISRLETNMARVAVLFAIASAGLLLAGLLVPFREGIVIHLGSTGFGMSGRDVCFIAAAFFCFFAGSYSLWMLPMSATGGHLHFWLTAFSTVAFWAALNMLPYSAESNRSRPVWLIASLAAFSIAAFTSAQVIFVVNISRAAYKLSQGGIVATLR